ncbi:TadE/TadG family type IV pilus assembly protein [Prosthecomicrobium sp. N25]|uniref:TadE/TadG family type IV pilus assembly protein n=1 Tax=Prosthecomicrobium sp. N25 TaxID=3129254 RepID=UPI0030784A23
MRFMPSIPLAGRGRAIVGDRAGNVAMTFALLSIPLLGAVGFAIDYGNAARVRAELQDAVDAAALAAVREFDGKSDEQIRKMVDATVRAEAPAGGKSITALTVGVDRATRQVKATATARVGTTLAGVFGQDHLDVSASTSVVGPTNQYVTIYLLLDNSASMGLAATSEAAAAMRKGVGCQFGCHEPEGGQKISNLEYARKNSIKLRIDTLHEGVLDIVSVAKKTDPSATYVKIGVSYLDQQLDNAVKPTLDRSKVEELAKTYSLGDSTFFSQHMEAFTNYVGKSGSGASASDPRKVVLMVTDGVQSHRPWVLKASENDKVAAFDPKECDKLKKNGVTVAILDAMYLPITGDWGYNATLGQPSKTLAGKTRRDEIEPALRACASTSYYLSAADDAGVKLGMTDLLSRYLSSVRLTN